MPDLREELARRLFEVHSPTTKLGDWEDLNHKIPGFSTPWLFQADECLRQMEWARWNISCEWAETEGFSKPKPGEDGPLTLAPPDWKP